VLAARNERLTTPQLRRLELAVLQEAGRAALHGDLVLVAELGAVLHGVQARLAPEANDPLPVR
jgi:hypothetical protein